MIFSMRKKFEEKGYYWNREERGWMKTIIGLDKTKKNGFSLIGDFINAGTNKNDYDAGLYLNCNKGGGQIVYQLLKVTDDEDVELLQELVNPGRGWAVEFWEKIDENLTDDALRPTYPDEFLNKTHFFGYVESIGFARTSSAVFDEVDDVDVSDINLLSCIKHQRKEIGFVCKTFFKDYSFDNISCEEIKHPNNLLNLNYLQLFKPDEIGFAINFYTGRRNYKNQKMILIFDKDGQICIRWFNHLMK